MTTLDLSKPTLEWAKENWRLNGHSEESAKWFAGDFFDWVPRFAKKGTRYDMVILDPPSFSRGPKGTFSTSKDLVRLHTEAIRILERNGVLVTSINSANVSRTTFEGEVARAAEGEGRKLVPILKIEQPESFPVRAGHPEDAYLKGNVYRVV